MEIIVAQNQKHYIDVYHVRTEVFYYEQNVAVNAIFDENDKSCINLIAYDNELPIATLRIVIDGKNATIGRVAVLKEYRKKGIGKALMKRTHKVLKRLGIVRISVGAQLSSIGFYEALGYQISSDLFVEQNIIHREMVKYL